MPMYLSNCRMPAFWPHRIVDRADPLPSLCCRIALDGSELSEAICRGASVRRGVRSQMRPSRVDPLFLMAILIP